MYVVDGDSEGAPALTVLESVRCLECAAVYSKPSGGGTERMNPGCPECGYVGWVSAAIPFTPPSPRLRFAGDPPLRRSAPSH